MKKTSFCFKDRYWLYIFLMPSVIALILLTLFPIIYSLRNSFYGWDLIKPGSQNKYVGLDNFIDILTSPVFWTSLKTTIIYSFFSVAGTVLLGSMLAFVMFRNLWGNFAVRTLAIAAMVISPAIIGTVFKLMLNPTWGLITWILSLMGISNSGFLASAVTVLPTLILVEVWEWSPLVMVIVLAGLQGLPNEVFEAARVDGAGGIKKFLYITLPMLKSSFMLAVLLRTIDSMRAFDLIFNMTQGGPGIASQTTNLLMYNTGFQFFKISEASAMAIILLIIISIFASLLMKLIKGGELLR